MEALEEWWNALQSGAPLERQLDGFVQNKVKPYAFLKPVHVRMKLATLEIDSSLWEHIDEFSGTIVDMYALFFVCFLFPTNCLYLLLILKYMVVDGLEQ
jgi:hypothetical protein